MNTIGFNTRRKEFSDLRVRQAIAHSVDIDFYTENFLLGYGKRAQGPIPSTSSFFVPGAQAYPFDPKKAETLLDEAGFKRGADGTRFAVRLNPNQSDDIQKFGTFIQQSLQKVGIKADIQLLDNAGYLTKVMKDWDFDLCTDTGTFRGDPGVGTTIWYRSGIPAGTPWSNQWGWKNEQLDRVADAALTELDPAKRKQMYGEFARIANAEIPVWMAMEQVFVSAVSARVRDDHNTPRWTGSSWADVSLTG